MLDPVDLAARVGHVLLPFVRQLRTSFDEGITPSQMSALATVDRQGPIALGDLAAAERVTPPMATKLANALQEKGLVERLACVHDRRVVHVQLTADGKELVERTRQRRDTRLATLLARLTTEERATLAAAVDAFERLDIEVEPRP